MSDADEIDVFTGPASPQSATLYVRLPGLPGGGSQRLCGEVRGPYCATGETLPASFALRDLGTGESLLAQARILDPVYWGPERPVTYRVRVELREGATAVRSWEVVVGLRSLRVAGDGLFLENRRWIVRGAGGSPVVGTLRVPSESSRDADGTRSVPTTPFPADPRAWALAGLTWFAEDVPTDEQLGLARDAGLPLIVALPHANEHGQLAAARRLASATAVIGVIGRGVSSFTTWRTQTPGLLLGTEPLDGGGPCATDADFLCATVDDTSTLRIPHGWQRPLFVRRPDFSGSPSPAELRAAADRLRRDLAPIRQCAGYFV